MSTPRFLIAQYVGDAIRKESENVGVIVWTQHGTSCRFLGEKNGKIDGRAVSAIVKSIDVYKQWVSYWRDLIESPAIKAKDGTIIERSSPYFLDAIKEKKRGSYHLEEGGIVLDPVRADELADLTEYLFSIVVEREDEPKDLSLDQVCKQVFDEVGLANDRNWHKSFKVSLDIDGITEEYPVSYAYKNGHLKALFQKVPFANRNTFIDKAISTSTVFNRWRDANVSERVKIGVLVFLKPDLRVGIDSYVALLRKAAPVYNLGDLTDKEQVKQQLKEIAVH